VIRGVTSANDIVVIIAMIRITVLQYSPLNNSPAIKEIKEEIKTTH
jgi:hypothetical protein